MSDRSPSNEGRTANEQSADFVNWTGTPYRPNSSIILVVTRKGHIAEQVVTYAINVAERMNWKILAAYVDTLPQFWDGGRRRRRFVAAVEQSAAKFRADATQAGVAFDYVRESGRLDKVVATLCHIAKRVEFVLLDEGIELSEVTSGTPVPVFKLRYESAAPPQGAISHQARAFPATFAKPGAGMRRRSITRTLCFGSMSALLYTVLFHHADMVMDISTRGGVYGVVPAVTALIFFGVHTVFAGNICFALGMSRPAAVRVGRAGDKEERRKASRRKNDRRVHTLR